ncbi:hypothetical protein GUJ93_ZPchr0004g39805 [Zizania palustris]|uniref:Aldehyde dehydrogenase domain-containing protein n=1 Tax=Zizania palustris TaxID=103762 RepID=A0A8J5T002_ZIZPA|nr:hypothetical protein GUJ93_ZPchr0004g39805 [Zizania palustris]
MAAEKEPKGSDTKLAPARISMELITDRKSYLALLETLDSGKPLDEAVADMDICLELGGICVEIGLPPGVLNIVTGLGHEAGSPSASHPHVDKIAFTGSTETGKKIMVTAAQMVKPVSLELGGKSPFIVFDDVDINKGENRKEIIG